MTVHIKKSKTDPFRMGHTITVGTSRNEICPVKAIQNYLMLRPPLPGPPFIFVSGKPLTKQNLTFKIRSYFSKLV